MHAAERLSVARRSALERARTAFPDVAGDEERFLAHVVERAGQEDGDLVDALEGLRVDDLWLALSATSGDRAAVAHVEALIGDAAARVRRTWAFDEVAQYLRIDAFVGAGGAPGLLRYGGRGRLASWFRVAAVRFAVGQAQRRRREVSLGSLDGEGPTRDSQGPELRTLFAQHKAALKRAVATAFLGLAPEERDLLWRTYVAGATVDVLGADLGVHRATAARRVARAREALLMALREQAAALLGGAQDEDDLDGSLDDLLVAAWREVSQSLATLTGGSCPGPRPPPLP